MKYRECRFHFFFVSCCFARFKLNEVIEERPNKTKHYDGREKLKIIFRLYIYIFILEYCVHVSITTLCTLLQLLRKEKFSVWSKVEQQQQHVNCIEKSAPQLIDRIFFCFYFIYFSQGRKLDTTTCKIFLHFSIFLVS